MIRIAFLVVAIPVALAAVRMVTTKNVVHGALFLLVVLSGAAVFFLMMAAEFVGWVQVLIYVGAVVVLLLFGLMLTRAPIGKTAMDNEMRPLAAAVAGAIFLLVSSVLWRAFDGRSLGFSSVARPDALGRELFTNFVFPFEAVSVLLLAALVGAVVLARKDD